LLLNYNFQYENFSIVTALNDVLSGIRHEGNLDENDLAVHQLSFLNVLMVDFEINSTFIGFIYFVVMFGSYVHKKIWVSQCCIVSLMFAGV
jgi:hypothetical protein